MMKSATKFTFDTVFNAGRDVATETSRARQRTALSEIEIEALRAEARAEGAGAAEVVALEAIAAGTLEAAQALRDILKSVAGQMEAVRAEAATVAYAVARKVAGSAR